MFELITVGAIFFGATVIQTITGFAGNLLAMPGTIQIIGMTDAKVAGSLANIITCLIVALIGFRSIIWKEFIKITLLVIPGMAAGFYLSYVLQLSVLLYAYGSVIIIIAIRSFFLPEKLKPLSLPMTVMIMTGAGLMQSLFVSGGAFVVIYAVHAFDTKAQFRATLSMLWVVLNIFIVFEVYLSGSLNLDNTLFSLYIVIPALLGVYIGNILHRKISNKGFITLSNSLLLISGLICFFKF